jgi:hypothetical protein
VVLEATYGWYWAADTLAAAGAEVLLAHPLGVKGFAYRRVKNDEKDAADLADLLRMGRLQEAWIGNESKALRLRGTRVRRAQPLDGSTPSGMTESEDAATDIAQSSRSSTSVEDRVVQWRASKARAHLSKVVARQVGRH